MLRAHHVVRVAGVASIAGSLSGLLIELVLGREWGHPGTTQYESYELANRLLSVPLVLMAVGIVGVYAGYHARLRRPSTVGVSIILLGFVLMVVGNVAEFFVFTSQPYVAGFNGRNIAWMAFGLGILMVGSGGVILGITAWRTDVLPGWVCLLLALYLPLSVVAFALGYLVLGLCVVSLGVAWLRLATARRPSKADDGREGS